MRKEKDHQDLNKKTSAFAYKAWHSNYYKMRDWYS